MCSVVRNNSTDVRLNVDAGYYLESYVSKKILRSIF